MKSCQWQSFSSRIQYTLEPVVSRLTLPIKSRQGNPKLACRENFLKSFWPKIRTTFPNEKKRKNPPLSRFSRFPVFSDQKAILLSTQRTAHTARNAKRRRNSSPLSILLVLLIVKLVKLAVRRSHRRISRLKKSSVFPPLSTPRTQNERESQRSCCRELIHFQVKMLTTNAVQILGKRIPGNPPRPSSCSLPTAMGKPFPTSQP